jgi:hypothetical protein
VRPLGHAHLVALSRLKAPARTVRTFCSTVTSIAAGSIPGRSNWTVNCSPRR